MLQHTEIHNRQLVALTTPQHTAKTDQTAKYCNTLQHTGIRTRQLVASTTPQHTATTATHCNTQEHTATLIYSATCCIDHAPTPVFNSEEREGVKLRRRSASSSNSVASPTNPLPCSALQCVAICRSVLQCVPMCCSESQFIVIQLCRLRYQPVTLQMR